MERNKQEKKISFEEIVRFLGVTGAVGLLAYSGFTLPVVIACLILITLINLTTRNRLLVVIYSSLFLVGSLVSYFAVSHIESSFLLILFGPAPSLIFGLYEQKKGENKERNQIFKQQLFSNIFDNSPDAIILMDYYSRKIIDCNQVAVDLFEVEGKSKIVGDLGHNFVLPVLTEEEFIECRKEISTKGKWTKKVIQKSSKGRSFNAEMHITPLKVEKNNYYVIRIRDITHELATKKNLRESTEKLANVLESIDSIVYNISINEEGKKDIGYLSKQIREICGLSVKEYEELSNSGKILDLYHPDDLESIIEKSRELKEKKQPVSLQYRFLHQGTQEYVWLEETVYPRFAADGRHIANFGITTNIEERKRYEDAIKASEERYRNLFERNLAGVYLVDAEDKMIVDCNAAFANILGFESRDQVIGKKTSELYEDSESLKVFYETIISKKQLFNQESEVVLKSGKVIWILENASLVREGSNTYVEGTILDITELKKIQKAYKESEETLSNVVKTIDDLIYNVEVNEDGSKDFKFISPQIENLVGITAEEYIKIVENGKVLEHFHIDDIDRIKENVRKIAKDKQPSTITYRFYHAKKDQYRWLEESIYPKVNDGVLVAEMGIIRDVTQKVEYEQKIKESEQRFRTLFERNLAGVFRSDSKGEIIECNNAFAQIFGYADKEQLIGLEVLELYRSISDREKYLAELKSEGYLMNYEMRLNRKDGSPVWVLVNVSISELNNRNEQFIEGTVIDITELKITSEALIESESRFRLLSESTLEGIVITDEYEIIDTNDQFVQMFGYESPDELLGESLDIVIAPDFRDTVRKKIESDDGKTYVGRALKKDGTIITVETTGKYIPYGGKTVRVSVVYDITSRTEFENRLKINEENFRNIAEHSPNGIMIHVNGKIEYANPTVKTLFDIKPSADVTGRNFMDFFAEKGKKEVEESLTELENGNDPGPREVAGITRKGDEFELAVQHVETTYHGRTAVYTILQSLKIHRQLAREQLRAKVAEDINKRLEQEIKDHKQTQKKLSETETFTRNIFNSSLDMIIASDTDQKISEINKSGLKLFGYEKHELVGEDPSILYASQDEFNKVKKEIEKKGLFTGEILNITKKGHVFPSFLSAAMIRNEEGEVVGMMGVSRDISEIKEAETQAKISEERYRDLFDNANDLIHSIDKDHQLLYVNTSWRKSMGYSQEDIEEMKIEDIIHPGRRKAFLETLEAALNGEKVDHIDTIMVSKTGEEVELEGSVTVRLDMDSPISVRMILRDVTDERKAERLVMEHSSKIRSIFESTADIMIWTMDDSFCLTSFNNKFEEMMNQHFGEQLQLGDSFFEMIEKFMRDDLKPNYKKFIRRAFKGDPQQFEGPLNNMNQEVIWAEQFLSPIRLEDGTINEVACLAHEITDKKINEKKVRDSLQEKEVLLKEVHHRVKNNLQVISSILNLQSSYVKDDNTLNILRESQNRIKSMSFIHESLYQNKNFSQINFSEYIINLSNNLVHSYQLHGDLVDLNHEIEEVHLNLDQAIPCGLIINELVSNALKYAFTIDQKGTLYLKISEKQGKVLIRVEDDGIGLPKDFDIYNTETLGLQLVITLTEQLDGELDVDTNSGTRYLITFEKQT